MRSFNTIIIVTFIISLIVYLSNLSFNYWIILTFVFLFISVLNLKNRFKYSLPFGELLALVYLIENAVSLTIIFLLQGNSINDIGRFYVQVPINMYLPYGLLATQAFLVGYTIINRPSHIWIEYITDIKKFIPKKVIVQLLMISLMGPIIGSFHIAAIGFVIYILSNLVMCSLVGLYLHFKGRQSNLFIISGVGINVISAIQTGMFTGTTLFLILIGFIYFTKKSITNAKINWMFFTSIMVVGIIVIAFIQNLKQDYRDEIWAGNEEGNTTSFYNNLDNNIDKIDLLNKDFFMPMLGRVNQAWLVSCTMEKVPLEEPFANGETIVTALKDALLPRILNPTKQMVGNSRIEKYTRLKLQAGTAMGIGYLGEAYVNFGILGGVICIGMLGVLFAFLEKKALLFSKKDPIILLLFPFYVMTFLSSGNDFFWIFNNITMGTLILFIGIKLLRKNIKNKIRLQPSN